MKTKNLVLLVFILTLTALPKAKAGTFTECLKNVSTFGHIVFEVDRQRLSSADELPQLLQMMTGLEFSIYNYRPDYGSRKNVDYIYTKAENFILYGRTEQGHINQAQLQHFEENVSLLLKQYSAIIKTSCPPLPPGTGGRIGG